MGVTAKPRRVMGIIFLILGIIGAIIASIILPISISKTMSELSQENNDAGAAIGAIFVAMILVVFIFFVFIDAIVCIPFLILSLIFTRASSIKWVRIVSYITDALFIYVIVVAIFKLIQLLVGF